MEIVESKLKGAYAITPKVFEDARGFFFESFSKEAFTEYGLKYDFVQDNQSYNKYKHTFRGLHYQKNPKAQTTLVRVVTGKILDIVVDIRKGSPTYGKYVSQILSADNNKQLLISKGFAHGFLTLTDNVNVLYKMDELYAHEYDRILNVRDNEIKISLDIDFNEIIIAEKDKYAPMLKDIDNNFTYKNY